MHAIILRGFKIVGPYLHLKRATPQCDRTCTVSVQLHDTKGELRQQRLRAAGHGSLPGFRLGPACCTPKLSLHVIELPLQLHLGKHAMLATPTQPLNAAPLRAPEPCYRSSHPAKQPKDADVRSTPHVHADRRGCRSLQRQPARARTISKTSARGVRSTAAAARNSLHLRGALGTRQAVQCDRSSLVGCASLLEGRGDGLGIVGIGRHLQRSV